MTPQVREVRRGNMRTMVREERVKEVKSFVHLVVFRSVLVLCFL